MGASESIQEDQQEDINSDHAHNETTKLLEQDHNETKKLLEQDVEISSFSTPRFDPSINTHASESLNDDGSMITELYVICHAECHLKLRPDLVGGRSPEAALTPNGKRQARTLALFFKSQGIQFNAVYTSPLDRVRATAIPVCQEMNFPEHMIQVSDALQEMSQGLWEGCQYSHVYTPSVLTSMERLQPDFCAPCGETLRQVEFRMLQFLNQTVVSLPENLRYDFSPPDSLPPLPKWDLPTSRPKPGMPKRKSSKSRLQTVRTDGDHEADDEMSPRVPTKSCEDVFGESSVKSNSINNSHPPLVSSCCIGIFSHSLPIKCLVTGILGCSPIMSNKICIQDSSMTVLQHSRKLGWQIKRVNDTCHLRHIM